MRSILLLLVFAFVHFVTEATAQVVGEDLPFLSTYQKELPYFQELITGGQYATPSPRIKGDPYFTSRQFEEGVLRINGITYPQVPLIYDTYRDQLITFHPIFNQKILIKPEKIDGFTLSDGQLFRFFEGNESFLHRGNGIYQVLGQGNTIALAKRYKTTKESREQARYDSEYVEKTTYFIWEGGRFTSIKNAAQAIASLGLDAKVLKRELKTKGLQFKKSPEAYLQFLVTYPKSN
ncbi:MAG: hypothetical protein ACO22X_03345 [Algoriphagus sp.]